jgi:autotransporter-associated beta strand protein
MKYSKSAFFSSLSLFYLNSLSATIRTWEPPSPLDINWSTAGNWSPAGAPVNGDTLLFNTFTGSGTNSNNNLVSLSPALIDINTGVFAIFWTLQGNAITTNNTVISSTTAFGITTSIEFPIILPIAQHFDGATGGSGDLHFTGVISSAGPGFVGITNSAGGATFFDAVNTYSGITTIHSGALRAGVAGAFPSTSSFSIVGTLDLNNFSQTVASITGTGNITLGTATLTTGGDNSSTTLSGVISGSGGLTKVGNGTLTLGGVNTYTGATTISGGFLQAGIVGALPSTSAVIDNDILDLNNFSQTVASIRGIGNVTLGTATLTTGGNNTSTTLFGVISGSGGLTKVGNGTFTLGGVNTYTGATTISGGTLQAGIAGALPSTSAVTITGPYVLDLNNFSQTVGSIAGVGNIFLGTATLTTGGNNTSTTFDGTISGSGGLTKVGTGILMLGGTNNYTGTTTISGGTLQAFIAGAFPPASAVIDNAILDLNGFSQTVASIAGTGDVGLGTATLTTGGDNSSTTLSGVITGSSGGLTKVGTGTFTLGGFSSYSGATTVSAGTLQAGIADAFSSTSAVTDNATLDLNNFSQTVASIAGTGNVTLGTATLTTGGNNASTTLSGIISGGGGLTKVGSGIFTLGGHNTYTGTTTISAGTLSVNGSVSSINTIVESGAILQGTGSLGAVQNNGTVHPGNSIGTLTVGSYTGSGGALNIEIASTSGVNSQLVVTPGGANLTGGILNISAPSGSSFLAGQTYIYDIILSDGAIIGDFSTKNFPFNGMSTSIIPGGPNIYRLIFIPPLFVGLNITSPNAQAVANYLNTLLIIPGSDLQTVVFALSGLNSSQLTKALEELSPAEFGAFKWINLDHAALVNSIFSSHLLQLECKPKPCQREKGMDCDQTEKLQEVRNSLWIQPYGSFQNTHRIGQLNGFEAQAGGFAMGFDHSFASSFVLGGGTGYSFTSLDWREHGGDAQIQQVYAGLYGGWNYKTFAIDISTHGLWNFYDTHRKIDFATIHRTARSDHTESGIATRLQIEYGIPCYGMQLMPYEQADYLFLDEHGYSEKGAHSINLKIDKRISQMVRNELGLQLSKNYRLDRGCWMFFVGVGWVRKILLSSDAYRSSFKGQKGHFTVHTFKKHLDFVAPQGGLGWNLGHGFSLEGSYQAEITHHYINQNGTIRLEYDF